MNRALVSTGIIIVIATALFIAAFQAVNTPIQQTTDTTNTQVVVNTANVNTIIQVPPSTVTPTLPAPTNLLVASSSSTSAKISWTGISGPSGEGIVYQVWRNGQKIATVTRVEFLDVFLVPGQELTYTVVAATVAGAISEPSSSVKIKLPTSSGSVAVITPVPTPSKPSTGTTNANTSKPATNTNTTNNTNTTTPPKNTNTTPTPPPTPTPTCGSGGSCTASDVAKHATRSNCWVYLSPLNKVYNITSYVSNGNKHPGGDVIAQYCGQNIYSYFIGSAGGHRHSNSALNSILAAYYIAAFQP